LSRRFQPQCQLFVTDLNSTSELAICREAKFPPGDIGVYRYQRRSVSVSVDVLRTDGKELAAQLENAADMKYY
jgi:hypothetical protein